ncbi:uncharacterized protein JCM10292_005167 [Rhodotorula paludigena]|uniref:uncharacterized protein n=1 Tax=Rhodotorula paludigena TaxID=86838 RepID=UPI0031785234
MSYHPLDPLTAAEISLASGCFRTELLKRGLKSIKSCAVSLVEPPKAEVVAFLGLPVHPTDYTPYKSGVRPARRAEAHLIDVLTGDVYVATCTFPQGGGKPTLDACDKQPQGTQPAITMEELDESEQVVKNDPEIIRLCAEIGVKPEEIMVDAWSVGYEDRFPGHLRLQQAFLYQRLGKDEHLYAHPLDMNAVVATNEKKVLKIDFAPHRTDSRNPDALSGTTAPHTVEGNSFADCGRPRIPPQQERMDYLPDLIKAEKAKQGEEWDVRRDIKQLTVIQPDGVSFSMNGNEISWQNWKMHIGFNFREGIVLSTVQYFDRDEKRYRPILYRTSFAEMVVPYGAPEWPHPRKFAFDVGEYGLGMMANSLALGCDCLGAIHYLDAELSNHAGQAVTLKNCVCIHEEDDGLLWKHTDFRPGGRAHAVRSRKLIIQMICTVANYEYAFAWEFKQDGTLGLNIKLTGILNTYTAAQGEKVSAFGTLVGPGVQAHHHQHIFCLRVDPMIDGLNNSVVETEVKRVDAPTGSAENWAGNGFYSTKRELKTTHEGVRDPSPADSRIWSIVNPAKQHYSSGHNVGYKIMCKDYVPLLPKDDSLVGRRAPFAKHALWTVPYEEGRLYPAGKFPTQTKKAPADSLEGWVSKGDSIANRDIIVMSVFGTTHIPRPEDWPVMPYEEATWMMKPSSFFRANPSLDVPASADKSSVRALGGGNTPMSEAKTAGKDCCGGSKL